MAMKQYKVTVTITILVHANDTNDAANKVRDSLEDEWFEVDGIEVEES
jgi:hypothetical protein